MRTSITLDDETYELAAAYASARRITLGAAVGELLRARAPNLSDRFPNLKTGRNGIPILSSQVGPITSEMVKAALEDEGL